jgi:hypothetical protein
MIVGTFMVLINPGDVFTAQSHESEHRRSEEPGLHRPRIQCLRQYA